MDDNKKDFNEEEFLKKVEKAASKGTSKATFRNILLSSLPTLLIIALLAYLIVPKVNFLSKAFKTVFRIEESVDGKDLTIENNGIFGYTAEDFEEAILGDSSKLKKIEVYEQEVSDATTIEDTGIFNLSIFSKNQVITYSGYAVYTVDLSSLRSSDIVFDQANGTITMYIPHAQQEEINIPEDRIDFGDTEKGLLAFGDIKMTVEDSMKIQAGVREKMQEKLDSQNVLDTADRFAILSVWEMYSPIVKEVSKSYALEVKFRDQR
ncbi:MAG: DUF4230 domain-containing protein [Erysipelotrichaceae bacterium]|nr:DUF4230 domain-containing protein [Erysipelotrichaceae bacterium]